MSKKCWLDNKRYNLNRHNKSRNKYNQNKTKVFMRTIIKMSLVTNNLTLMNHPNKTVKILLMNKLETEKEIKSNNINILTLLDNSRSNKEEEAKVKMKRERHLIVTDQYLQKERDKVLW
jgi:hypothetical protein